MSQKLAPEKIEIIEVDSNNVEIVDKNNSSTGLNASNGSIGKEIATTVAVEVAKGIATVGMDQIKKHLDNERDGKKKIRDTRIDSLQMEINNLMENIRNEEAKEAYDQERINRWYNRLDKKEQELKDMQDEADSFAKGLLKTIKEFISMKSQKGKEY